LIYKHVGLVSAKRNTELLSNSLIMVAVDLHALLQDAIKYLPTEQLSIRIELPAEQNRSLYAAGQTDTFQPNPVKLELSRHADLFIQNNYLRLSFEATQNYLTEQFSWDVWSVLNGGFLVAALFSAGLLVITARHSITESIVASRTRDLKQENSQRVRTQQLLAMQSSVLEMIASDADLNRILARICVDIEKLSPQGTIASVMLVDAEGRMLNLVEAPSLAGEFRACLQNFPIGENQGSCGTAVYRGEQVVVEDISNDPLWQDHLDLAASAGLKSCWSTPFFRKDGKVLGAFALSHTTQRKPGRQDHAHMKAAAFLSSLAVEQAHAREQMNRLSLAVEQSPSAVIMTDTSGQIEYVNQKFTEITQYRADEARGRNADRLLQSDFSENDLGEIHATLFSGKEWRGSLLNRRKDGSEYWAQYYISPVRNQHNEITHIVGIHDDITETRRSHEKITYQATHDLLTGLFNRSEFERRLDILLATTSNETTQHTLCFIDLDQFKIVNDTCGHVAGDELLRQLASIMQKNIRKHDVLARVGGDEFAILFEHCELAQALETANTLRQQVAEHIFSWDDRSFNVGLSAGLVAINQHSPNRVELLREADAACYAAKDTGRNRIHIYHEDDETTARRSSEIRWARKVREALREDRFILYQQLISPLQQAQAPCFEILLRMLTPDGDIIAPDQFLPAAERYNIAPEVDAWVVERAFMLIQKSPQLLEQVEYFSINLSGLSLNTGFAGQIIDWLQQYNLPPQKICLEITETAAIGNLSHAIEFIDKLKQVGIRFALDDFGSGLSSFAYLKNLHVDVLKIDGQFVRDILSDPMDLAMVKSINEIGKVMGKTTVAEFVESEAVRNKLRELGIDYAQGYGIAEPEPCRPIQPSAQAS
jgi:diguanylate cyclase (GGDEF)-like protein/PAS domain S-box-containing protein